MQHFQLKTNKFKDMTNREYKEKFAEIYKESAKKYTTKEECGYDFSEFVEKNQQELYDKYIGECRFFVTMTDGFMSGWGAATNKINKYVVCCRTIGEALIVESNAQKRAEMKYIRISRNKPNYPTSKYLTSWAIVPQMGEIWVDNLNNL